MENYSGFDALPTGTSEWNQMDFAVRQILAGVKTAELVLVEAVRPPGGELAPVGFVDVRPMVAQLDAKGQAVPHGTIYNLPYTRIQGGANAVVIDPQPGDIGIAVFCGRDISSVKQTKKPGNPGSLRKFDWADGVYIGGTLNGTPTQYIRFTAEGIEIVSPSTVTIRAPDMLLDGDVMVTGSVTADGDIVTGGAVEAGGNVTVGGTLVTTGDVTAAGKSLATHTHGGVTTGGGTSGPPS